MSQADSNEAVLVPKLPLEAPESEALASQDGKQELPAPNSQAGDWELAKIQEQSVKYGVDAELSGYANLTRPTVLPQNWLQTNLGSVVDYGKIEKAEPTNISDDTWVLELEDIEKDNSKIIQRLNFLDRQSKSTKNRFKKGDVLYGKLRPYLNKVVVADSDGVCTTEIVPLSGGENLNNRYLFFWLKHPTFLAYVSEVGYGVNMPRLGTKDGIAAPFVLAPLAEQQQIAAKLDELLAQVDILKTRLDTIPKILKCFRQSVLAAATSGVLTEEWRSKVGQNHSVLEQIKQLKEVKAELVKSKTINKDLTFFEENNINSNMPDEWAVLNLASICSKITDGEHITPRRSTSGKWLISARNVINNGIKLDDVDFVDEEEFLRLRKRCDPQIGDILISCSGSVGRIALVDRDDSYVMVRSAAMIRPLSDFITVYSLFPNVLY